jgi:anti-sigma regulatory factor (Ser/Thr protein kinase)
MAWPPWARVPLGPAASEERVGLLYADASPGHDPFAAVAPPDDTAEVEERPVGGLGLVLIAALASEVQYRREDGKNLISLTITGAAAGSP